MTLVNHLIDVDTSAANRAVAYGYHLVHGYLRKSFVTGSAPNHQITLQQVLGRGRWNAVKMLYWNNIPVPASDYVFHPGAVSTGFDDPVQGRDEIFDTDVLSLTPWLRVRLQPGIGEADVKNSPPVGLQAYCETKLVSDYDRSGNETDFSYSLNPARQILDLIIRQGKRSTALIDFGAWNDFRDHHASNELQDYSTLDKFEGFGLTATYYIGKNFETVHSTRIDPIIFFEPSDGSPAFQLPADDFSANFEGKIKFPFDEEYTLFLTHDAGGRLWLDSQQKIDEWSAAGTHQTTFTPNGADTFHDVKIQWFDDAAAAQLSLEWQSASQPREVVPSKYLYPKPELRAKYETSPFFDSRTRVDDAVRTILRLCNSTYQKINGKYRFFSLEQLSESSFTFNDDRAFGNVLSVKLNQFDRARLRNSYTAYFRDLQSRFLEAPKTQMIAENTDLISLANGTNGGEDLNYFNCTRWQAWKLLNLEMRRKTLAQPYQIEGRATTYPVIAGDRVSINCAKYNWVNKELLVTESNDKSAEETALERTFTVQDWIE